jgi:hypothetical protein
LDLVDLIYLGISVKIKLMGLCQQENSLLSLLWKLDIDKVYEAGWSLFDEDGYLRNNIWEEHENKYLLKIDAYRSLCTVVHHDYSLKYLTFLHVIRGL